MCLALAGHDIVGIDKNTDRVEVLRRGKIPILEYQKLQIVAGIRWNTQRV